MDTQEIQEQLKDNQEATVGIEERVTQLENKEIRDYNVQFDELKRLLQKQGEQDKAQPIWEKLKDQAPAMTSLVAVISKLIQSQEYMVKDFPKELKVKVLHRFEDKTKGFIIGGMVMLIITAIAVGTSFHLWSENGRMKENDVKFRMIRQTNPKTAHWADNTYHRNPDFMEDATQKLEAEQLAIAQAEAAAKQKENEAVQAKKEADSLKKRQKMRR